MSHEIGAYEAKTTTTELLRQVQAGKRFTITHRGATRLPSSGRRPRPHLLAAIGEKRAWYSTLRAIAGGNYDYIAYLIGVVGALVCPATEERMGGQR